MAMQLLHGVLEQCTVENATAQATWVCYFCWVYQVLGVSGIKSLLMLCSQSYEKARH
jgi:hypothetical protein